MNRFLDLVIDVPVHLDYESIFPYSVLEIANPHCVSNLEIIFSPGHYRAISDSRSTLPP